jgi:uncharacterized protein
MSTIPDEVVEGWEKREGPIVLTTVNEEGLPNAIYAGCVKMRGNDDIVVADNYFCKTRANIEQGSKGSLLFITADGKSFQLKGALTRHCDDVEHEAMKKWLDAKYPGEAAVVLSPEEVYCGAARIG